MTLDPTKRPIYYYLLAFSLTNIIGMLLLLLGYKALSAVLITISSLLVIVTVVKCRSLFQHKPEE